MAYPITSTDWSERHPQTLAYLNLLVETGILSARFETSIITCIIRDENGFSS